VAPNETFFFTVQGQYQGRAYVHTLHFREILPSVGVNPAQDLIDKWQSACQTTWLLAHPPSYTMTRLTAQKICGTPPLPARVEEGSGLVGTRNVGTMGELLPGWLSIAVNESTNLAGRRRHGRFFLSGGGENDIIGETLRNSAGDWLPVVTAYVSALSTRFVGPTAPTDWQLVVHSRKEAEIPGKQCQDSSAPVTALGIVSRLTTQRSRRA